MARAQEKPFIMAFYSFINHPLQLKVFFFFCNQHIVELYVFVQPDQNKNVLIGEVSACITECNY